MRFYVGRAVATALMTLVLDELVKSAARLWVAPCPDPLGGPCQRLGLVGPLFLVRTANSGSAMGYAQGLGIWVLLAAVGVLLIGVYARWLRGGGRLAALAVGLQLGGALGNLLDRLVLGGASDVLYVGWGPTWNLADVAIGLGTLLAIWALARRRAATDEAPVVFQAE
jgi:signal peptidase II